METELKPSLQVQTERMETLEGKISPKMTIPEEDDHPQPSEKSKREGWITFPFITGSVMGLSIAAGGWASNLIVFLITEFNVKSITAAKISNVALGCSSLFPLASAIIADSFFGSFPVVSFFAFVSLLGMIMFTLMATIHTLRPAPCAIGSYTCETPSNLQYAVLYMTITLASLGLGGTRFTIATMGAQQFDKTKDQANFFGWYYLTLYVANIISFTAIIYIQDSVSWGLGFALCALANAIGLAALVLGKRLYRQDKPKGSPFMSIARVLVAAIRKRKASGTFGSQDYYYSGTTQMLKMEDSSSTKRFSFLDRAALRTEGDRQSDGSYERSWRLCTMEEVADLKSLLKVMPLWSTGILLGTAIGIFGNLTLLQALTMNRHLGSYFKIPAASFLVFNLLGTAISIFVIDHFLLPTWQNLTRQSLIPLQRIGVGHIFTILSLAGCVLIETRRLHVIRSHQLGLGQPGVIVPMSALWLALPLAMIGVGEGFYVPGLIALCYEEFPESLKSTSTAMASLLLGIGFYLSTAIMDLIERTTAWLPDNINDGRLDYVYWVLVAGTVVNFGFFLLCARLFKYQKHDEEHDHGPSGLVH